MKRYIGNIRIDVTSESTEALHYLLETIVDRLNKKPPGVTFEDVGTAQLKKAKLSRVRAAPARKR